jgi:hypothetical protein
VRLISSEIDKRGNCSVEKFGEQKIDIVLDTGEFENSFTKLIFNRVVEL